MIQAGPCTVLGIRTRESHGYDALQLGFEAGKKKNVSKPAAGVFKKVNVAPMRVVREIRLEKTEMLQGYQVGKSRDGGAVHAGRARGRHRRHQGQGLPGRRQALRLVRR